MGTEDVLAAVPTDPAALAGVTPRAAETWLRIVQVHDRITHRVDSALHREHALSLTGFEALRRIAEAPGERATMSEARRRPGRPPPPSPAPRPCGASPRRRGSGRP